MDQMTFPCQSFESILLVTCRDMWLLFEMFEIFVGLLKILDVVCICLWQPLVDCASLYFVQGSKWCISLRKHVQRCSVCFTSNLSSGDQWRLSLLHLRTNWSSIAMIPCLEKLNACIDFGSSHLFFGLALLKAVTKQWVWVNFSWLVCLSHVIFQYCLCLYFILHDLSLRLDLGSFESWHTKCLCSTMCWFQLAASPCDTRLHCCLE